MRFIIDAHIPRKITKIFEDLGQEAIHTKDLPRGNSSTDNDILKYAGKDGIVISKDEDFYLSFLIKGEPSKLVMVKVGNMRLTELANLFEKNSKTIIELLGQYDLIELHKDKIIAIV